MHFCIHFITTRGLHSRSGDVQDFAMNSPRISPASPQPFHITRRRFLQSSAATLALSTLGMKDAITKKIRVVPLGFPFEAAVSATAKGGAPARK